MNKTPYTVSSLFDKVKDILIEKGLYSSIIDYANASGSAKEIRDGYFTVSSKLAFGGSEGIYLDLNLELPDGQTAFGTVKTLEAGDEAMRTMGRLYADIVLVTEQLIANSSEDFIWSGFRVEGKRFDKPLYFSYTPSSKPEEYVRKLISEENVTSVRITDYKTRQVKEICSFLDDPDKMLDFSVMEKDEFLNSYSYLTVEEYDMTLNGSDYREYGGYHFRPERDMKADIKSLISRNSLKFWGKQHDFVFGEKAAYPYTPESFMAVMDDDADVYKCAETGRYYVPCEHEMMELSTRRRKT